MRKIVAIACACWCISVAPGAGFAQCEATVLLTERTFIRSGGKTYTNCAVHLEVNRAGFWVNGALEAPFVSFVDQLDDATRAFYRSTRAYRRAAQAGNDDRDALSAVALVEGAEVGRLVDILSTVTSAAELDSVRHIVFADTLIRDFVVDLHWSDHNHTAGYRSAPDSGLVGVGVLCSGWEGGHNPRDWDQYLHFLMSSFCDQIDRAKALEMLPPQDYFDAAVLGMSSASLFDKSRDHLIESLESY